MYKSGSGRVIRFGAFEFRPGELRKHGIRIRLQGKSLQLLQALLERPGEVVAREELRDRLWAADTFVDFESGLNTAVNRLRLALGDSAEHPRYIGTLARSGYQFLAPVSEGPSEIAVDVSVVATPPPRPVPRRITSLTWPVVAAAALLLAAAVLVSVRRPTAAQSVYHQVTFRRFNIESARFAPDSESVIYEAMEAPGQRELYIANTLSPESRSLGFRQAALASVSGSGELALVVYDDPKLSSLVRVPLNGGSPLPLDRDVCCADWSPDGSAMAVIRLGARQSTLEFPRGHTIYRSAGWLSHVRVSPSGKEVAFIEHLVGGDDAGNIMMIDENGTSRTLASGWASAWGLAWHPSGRELWFTAARAGALRCLYAMSLSGKLRQSASFLGALTLHDISRTGRLLISRDQSRVMMAGLLNGEIKERDLSWFDYSHATAISDDGRVILFDETGEGGGAHHAVYIRHSDAPSATRVSDGYAMALSPDGTLAITMPDTDQTRLNLVPLTPGQPRTLSGYGVTYDWVRFFPDGRRLLVGGSLKGGPMRLFVQALDGGRPAPLNTSVYLSRPAISPDGAQIAGIDADKRLVLLPSGGGEPRAISAGFAPSVLRWCQSGKSILAQSGPAPAKLIHVDIVTGTSTPWKELAPADLSGVSTIWPAAVSADERSTVYSFRRQVSELFVVDGLVSGPLSH